MVGGPNLEVVARGEIGESDDLVLHRVHPPDVDAAVSAASPLPLGPLPQRLAQVRTRYPRIAVIADVVHQDEMVAIRKTWQNLAKNQFRYLKPVCVPQHQNAPMRREHRFEVNREDVGPAGLDGREPLWIDEAGDPWGDCRRPVVALTQTYD